MSYELNLHEVNSEVSRILSGSGDTIYFDESIKTFRIEYLCGYAVDLSLDKFIDIL